MNEFAQQNNRAQNRHFVSPARPDHAKSRHAPAWNPYLTQQSTWGNQGLQRLLRTRALQAKLKINEPGDKYEQEADRVAEQVMRMPEPPLQRQAAPEEEEDLLQTKPLLQQRVNDGIGTPSKTLAIVQDVMRSPSRPLDPAARAFLEPRFGHDFSQVRIHTDAQAAAAASTVNARAFTVGRDLVFGAGENTPETASGRRLLAHELTHVVQQQKNPPQPIQCKPLAAKQDDDLVSSRFQGDPVLEAVLDGERLLAKGETGSSVARVQESLEAQGYTLDRFGVDGIFGDETSRRVQEFQVDVGAERVNGIVDADTMHLFDMHDPGLTLGTRARDPDAPTPRNVDFLESKSESLSGFDDTKQPARILVPEGERRRVRVRTRPVEADPIIGSYDLAIAASDLSNEGIVITGHSEGTTTIGAWHGHKLLAQIAVIVLKRRKVDAEFHFLHQTNPIKRSTIRSSGDIAALAAKVNQVMERQANVRFSATGSERLVPDQLTPTTRAKLSDPRGRFKDLSMSLSKDDLLPVMDDFKGSAHINVFFVWELDKKRGPEGDTDVNGWYLKSTRYIALEDHDCHDGFDLAHELGHWLTPHHGHDPEGLMHRSCSGPKRPRIFADRAMSMNRNALILTTPKTKPPGIP